MNIPVTTILTMLLFFSLASHQYSPVSLEKAFVMLQDPVISHLLLHVIFLPLILLNTLHSVRSFKEPSQFTETDSYSKNCSRDGMICGKVASEKDKKRPNYEVVSFPN